jgi:hypothetical protein
MAATINIPILLTPLLEAALAVTCTGSLVVGLAVPFALCVAVAIEVA